jgi:tRNA A37 N6-isopentenylltransferase MiaA
LSCFDAVTNSPIEDDASVASSSSLDVRTFIDLSNRAIAPLSSPSSLPPPLNIVVGGTSYWFQSFVFQDEIESNERIDNDNINSSTDCNYDNQSTEELYRTLVSADKVLGDRIHFNDRRKVINALRKVATTSTTSNDKSATKTNVQAPIFDLLIFYVSLPIGDPSKVAVIQFKMFRRILSMISGGALVEILDLMVRVIDHKKMTKNNKSPANADSLPSLEEVVTIQGFSHGAFQSIGYKELVPYVHSIWVSTSNNYEESKAALILTARDFATHLQMNIRSSPPENVNFDEAKGQTFCDFLVAESCFTSSATESTSQSPTPTLCDAAAGAELFPPSASTELRLCIVELLRDTIRYSKAQAKWHSTKLVPKLKKRYNGHTWGI